MARITFDTTPYELAHGCSPRGRGCWSFAPFHLRKDSSAAIFSPCMTLTQAKQWAKAHIAKAQEAGTIDSGWTLWAVLG